MIEVELVIYDREDPDTYPSVCQEANEVESRFGFVGGELLIFSKKGTYLGQLVNRLPE